MAAIRTVTITLSPLLRDLIVHLDIVGEFDARDGLLKRLRTLGPDLVLIGLGKDEGDEIGLSLAQLLPHAKVIAFSSDGRNAFVHRMQPQRTELRDVSPQTLIDAIFA